jgi:hypothetical protein
MSKRAYVAVVVGGFLQLASAVPAFAQDVDRITGTGPSPGGGFRAPEGVRVVSPGALLFASFERNFDGKISADEIAAGAEGAFIAADRNKDGAVTGFEQNDWAVSVGAATDVLANPMTFDIDLDRTVTKAEFTTGLKRLAGQLSDNNSGELVFADLVKPLNRSSEEASNGGFNLGTVRMRGSPPGGSQAGGTPNVSGGIRGQ